MLNSIQHQIESRSYEILKQVQDDRTGLFTRPSYLSLRISFLNLRVGSDLVRILTLTSTLTFCC